MYLVEVSVPSHNTCYFRCCIINDCIECMNESVSLLFKIKDMLCDSTETLTVYSPQDAKHNPST